MTTHEPPDPRPEPPTAPAVSTGSARPATPAAPAISATALRKTYGDKPVLAGIDIAVPEGTVFALLGPNGAGKTTTVRILSTLVAPDAGSGPLTVGGTTWPGSRRRYAPRSA